MRIAYFTEVLTPPVVDGVAHTLGQLFSTLHARGTDFVVFAPFPGPPSAAWRGRVHPLRSVRFPLYETYRVSLPLEAGSRVADRLDAFRPDLIHLVSPTPTAVWAQRYARPRDVPVVASFHTDFVSYFRYHGIGALEGSGWRFLRWFYGRCRRVYAPTHSAMRILRERGIGRTALWSRGIDTQLFSPARRSDALRRELDVSDDQPLLLFVSRLVREKDLADLVSASRILGERGVRFRLALVGDGALRRELERELPDAVFAGRLQGEELARWYSSADVFVLPSTTETFGNVVLEAMASGLPAVVVDRGGPRDLVEAGATGFVARPNDPPDLARALERLLLDRGLREHMGAAARASTLRRSWDRANSALLADYASLVREDGDTGVRRAG